MHSQVRNTAYGTWEQVMNTELSWWEAVPLISIEHELAVLRNMMNDAPYNRRPQIVDAITHYEMQKAEYLRQLGRTAVEDE